jgi:hypothetical protein
MATVAIQPDYYEYPSSPKWAGALEAHGYEVRWVDVYRGDILEQLKGCVGFMWRWGQYGGMGRIARRLLPVLENELGMVVYPDQKTCWHYDDKIAQFYLLQAHGILIPKTYLFFNREAAREWAQDAPLPLVLKFAAGAGSQNVRLIESRAELFAWIDRVFTFRLSSLDDWERTRLPLPIRLRKMAGVLKRGVMPDLFDNGYDLQTGYILLQEFLPNNPYDTRVTIVGKRGFGFLRYNREGDFRASGSGMQNFDPAIIDQTFIRLGYQIAEKLACQSVAIDGLYSHGECAVCEISYTYLSKAVHDCPGHWELEGKPESGELIWVEGPMWPEQAQVEDFIERLREREG